MDYEYYYNNAKSKYYNACSEINSCENRINELNNQKWQKLLEINQINTEIRNTQEALSNVEQMVRKDVVLNDSFTKITNTTDQASNNYMHMISSGDVSNKNLNDVYRDEINTTKGILNSIFDTLRNKKNNLSNKIAELQNQLQSANSEYLSFDSAIRITEVNKQEWISVKTSASYDMEYYKRKMRETL